MINFYNGQHAYYCGVDLHKKTMYVYVLNRDGETDFHKKLRTRRCLRSGALPALRKAG